MTYPASRLGTALAGRCSTTEPVGRGSGVGPFSVTEIGVNELVRRFALRGSTLTWVAGATLGVVVGSFVAWLLTF